VYFCEVKDYECSNNQFKIYFAADGKKGKEGPLQAPKHSKLWVNGTKLRLERPEYRFDPKYIEGCLVYHYPQN